MSTYFHEPGGHPSFLVKKGSHRLRRYPTNNKCRVFHKYTDYKDYLTKYAGKPQQTALKLLGNYFEGVGLLVHMKLVETDIVFNFWRTLRNLFGTIMKN
jgi:hypothetical protein